MSDALVSGSGVLPPELARSVDRVCDRFEAAWQGGTPPRIEDFLDGWENPGRAALLRELLALEIYYRRRAGQEPRPEDYGGRFPELDAAEAIRAVASEFADGSDSGRAALGAGALRAARGALLGQAARATLGRVPPQLGEYRILREVGRGGMGVVFEAVQESLGRHVALKVLPSHSLLGPVHLERFRREAQAAARLHHTNIVPVFGVGVYEGVHYYAMQFIHGQGLDKVLQEVCRLRGRGEPTEAADGAVNRLLAASVAEGLLTGQFPGAAPDGRDTVTVKKSPLTPSDGEADAGEEVSFILAASIDRSGTQGSPGDGHSEMTSQPPAQYFRSVAQLGVQVAEALAYAHQEGVLHRDIKPSNLLLDTAGRAWVTDFGLAKADDADDLTAPGDVIGTLRYLAPERLHGQGDARSDVYGLGVTLYELLTLRPAFQDAHRDRLMKRVAHEEPPRPRQLDRSLPWDLETIVLTAMAKEPARRYATAGELADDLRRFLEDRPIRARRPTLAQKVKKWARRNRAVVRTAAAAALVAGAVLAGSIGWVLRDRAEREAAVDREVQHALDEAATQLEDCKWPEAGAAVERAGKLLRAAGRSGFPPRLEDLQKDVAMAGRLEEIYHQYHDAQAAEYAQAFQDYGLDMAILPVAEAAERIRARPIRLELARALDLWSSMRPVAGDQGSPDWKQLLEVARQADPDPWRLKLRDALQKGDRKGLEALAASADISQLPPGTLHLLGSALNGVGAPEQAVALLRRAQTQYPMDVSINDSLGWFCWTALRPPQHDESARYYTAAVAARPHSPFLRTRLGEALVNKGAFREAIAEFSKVIELDPRYGNGLASLWRGGAYERLGQWDKAVADYSRVTELTAYAPAWNHQGWAYEKLGQWHKAVAAYSKVIELDPKDAWAWMHRGWASEKLEQWDQAVASYSKATELDPKDAWAWTHRGRASFELRQWAQAAASYSKAVELDPKLVEAWERLGIALRQQGKSHEAEAAWRQALHLKPDLHAAHCNLAMLHLDQGKLTEAATEAREAIRLWPECSYAHASLLRASTALGRWEQAATEYARLVEQDPGNQGHWYLHAALRLYLGDREGYRRACGEMLHRFGNTDDPAVAEQIAKTCLLAPDAASDPGRVGELADRAIRKRGADRWILLTRGLAEYRAGRPANAIPWLKRMAPTTTGGGSLDAMAFAALALAHHQRGQAEEARAALAQARTLIRQKMPNPARGQHFGGDWHDWLRGQILHREAEALLKPGAASPSAGIAKQGPPPRPPGR